jgi:hypothetical protein
MRVDMRVDMRLDLRNKGPLAVESAAIRPIPISRPTTRMCMHVYGYVYVYECVYAYTHIYAVDSVYFPKTPFRMYANKCLIYINEWIWACVCVYACLYVNNVNIYVPEWDMRGCRKDGTEVCSHCVPPT